MAQLKIDLVVDDKGSVVVKKFGGDVAKSLDTAGVSADGFGRKLALGGAALTGFVGIVGTMTAAIGGKGLQVFAQIEEKMIGVQKTTDFTGSEMDAFGKSITDMARKIPVATGELLDIAGVAGQLGIKGVDNITKFTSVMGKLSLATDVAGAEGAASIARLLNVTGEGVEQIDTFGAVLVGLGNNSAATESEILGLATQIGQATAAFSVSSTETLAMGAAMKSLGVQAELGGSVVGRSMRAIEASITAGGEQIKQLSQVTGIAEKDLKRAFGENATNVFQKFLQGIGGMIEGGKTAAESLELFGLKGDEVLKVLPTMAVNTGVFDDALRLANEEVEKGTALNDEAAKAGEGLAAQMKIVGNITDEMANKIGAELAPQVKELVGGFTDWWKINGDLVSQDIAGYFRSTVEALQTVSGWLETATENASKWNAVFHNLTVNRKISELQESLGKANEDLYRAQEGWFGFGKASEESVAAAKQRVDGLQSSINALRSGKNPFDDLTAGVDTYAESIRLSSAAVTDAWRLEHDKSSDIIKVSGVAAKAMINDSDTVVKAVSSGIDKITKKEQEALKKQQKIEDEKLTASIKTTEMQILAMNGLANSQGVAADSFMTLERLKSDAAGAATKSITDDYQDAAEGIEHSFGNELGDFFTTSFDSIGDAWDGLWKGMLGAAAQYIGDIAAQFVSAKVIDWATELFFSHSGTWEVGQDEKKAVLLKGQMVLPPEESEILRNSFGDGDFSGLGAAVSTIGSLDRDAAFGLMDFGARTGIRSAIGLGSNPGADIAGAGFGAISDIAGRTVDRAAGIDPSSYSRIGHHVGSILGAIGFGKLGAVVGNAFGGLLGDAIGDLMDDRDFEGWRDALESGTMTLSEYENRTAAARMAAIKDELTAMEKMAAAYQGIKDSLGFGSDDGGYGARGGNASDSSSSGSGMGGFSGADLGKGGEAWIDGGVPTRVYGRGFGQDDGMVSFKLGEGIVSRRGMQNLEKINNGGLQSNDNDIKAILLAIATSVKDSAKSLQRAIYDGIPTASREFVSQQYVYASSIPTPGGTAALKEDGSAWLKEDGSAFYKD